jgi:hypothetical protein
MKGLALFRRNRQPQSLIKAPSADLIKADTAPEIPEMVEIECKLSPEELTKYLGQLTGNTPYWNYGLKTENLRHVLKKLGYKRYSKNSLSDFTKKTWEHMAKKEGLKRTNFSTSELVWDYGNYNYFIPPRIINKVDEIRSNFVNPDDLEFTIMNSRRHVFKTSSETYSKIFFLKVRVKLKIQDDVESLIIDAWRGPTFSDEEAKI